MTLLSFIVLIFSSALVLINLLSVEDFYKKIITFFYFSANIAMFLILGALHYSMFGFVVYAGITLLFVNMILILILLYNRAEKGGRNVK